MPSPSSAVSSPFGASDTPATRADLFEGMGLLPGEGVHGFVTPPLRPSFAPALLPDWHTVHSPDYPAVKWVEPIAEEEPAEGTARPLKEHAVDWKTLALWQRKAAAYIARAIGIAPGDEGRYWTDDPAALIPGLRGERMAPVVGFVAAGCDPLTYRLLSAGCERLGLIPLLVSANNSAPAIAHLLAACNAQAVIGGPQGGSPPTEAKLAQALRLIEQGQTEVERTGARLTVIHWPSFDSLFLSDTSEALPIATPFAKFELERPLAILHSSGTTALFPKPIVLRHRQVMANTLASLYGFPGDVAPTRAPREGCMRGGVREATILVGHLPAAHAMAFYVDRYVLYTSASAGYLERPGKPGAPKPITPTGVLESAAHFENVALVLPPALLEGIAKDEKLLNTLKRWPKVVYSGASLPLATYKKLLSEGICTVSILASTESAISSRWWYDGTANDDPFPPDICGALEASPGTHCHFRPLSAEERMGAGLAEGQEEYELVHTARGPYAKPAVFNAEWEGEPAYATGDRVRLLPRGKSGQARFVLTGRLDPGIVLSTGEKTNPQPMVAEVEKSDAVAEALMFGQAKQFNGTLVRPDESYGPIDASDDAQVARFRNAIWPFVERANAIAPSHSAIYKEMILVASEDKPFEYTAKGTLRNGATLEAYKAEIEQVYARFEAASASGVSSPPSWADAAAVHNFTRDVVAEALRVPVTEVDPAQDMFQHLGADSLVATKIRNVLLASLAKGSGKDGGVRLPSNFVYAHPSVDALSDALVHAAANGSANGDLGPSPKDREQVLQALIDKYTSSWPQRKFAQNGNGHGQNGHSTGSSAVFLVTGTTGGAGAHFLAQLARHGGVSKVYALNRRARDGAPLQQRQRAALRTRSEPEGAATDEKVVLLEADTADQERLGLPVETYEQIRDSVTHVIHNAWNLDFNLSVSSFEDQIASARALALLALRSPRAAAPRLLFLSSVAVAADWAEPRPVPEAPLSPLLAGGSGYGQAKAVAEAVLLSARREAGLEATAIRAGQLSGSSANGAWAATDWVPLLFKSGLALGCLPACGGGTCWLPSDVAARCVVELALAPEPLPEVLHVVNPRPAPWSRTIEAAAAFLRPLSDKHIRLVPPGEWAEALRAAAEDDDKERDADAAIARNPALKLAAFFADLAARADAAAQDGVPREALGPPRLETREAARLSETLRAAKPTDERDVLSWLEGWQREGFLPRAKVEGR